MKYIQRKRKEKLVNQWVSQAGLPPEEVTPELLGEKPTKEAEFAGDDITREQLSFDTAMTHIDRGMVRLPIRYVVYGLAVIAVLLIALSVIVTVLIIR
ncbi:hypothetical protein ACFLYR_08915 [Chloroflexota bacterium]